MVLNIDTRILNRRLFVKSSLHLIIRIEFFCFDGKPVYFWTVFNDKTDDVCANFYDAISLKKINLRQGYPNTSRVIEIPKEYNEMFNIACKLSEGFPFVRIDFFKTQDGYKFSEMTFYHFIIGVDLRNLNQNPLI